MGWPGPMTDWQFQVWVAFLNWKNRDPNAGPEFKGDPAVWKRWQQNLSKARFDLSGAALNARRRAEMEKRGM